MKPAKFALINLALIAIVVSSCVEMGKPNVAKSPTAGIVSTQSVEVMPTPTITLAPIPTLPVEDAYIELLALLTNNANCQLPCLWGIVPGQSSPLEAEKILIPFLGISSSAVFKPEGGMLITHYLESDITVDIYVSYLNDMTNAKVSSIALGGSALREIEGGGESVFDAEIFGERTSYYTLPNILATYGRPEVVRLATQAKDSPRDDAGGGFHILLLYPELGIAVTYTTQMKMAGTNVQGCPRNAHFDFHLYPASNRDAFLLALNNTYAGLIKENLEEVTTMSIDEFYQTFRAPTDKCIETPASLWPIPD